MKRILFVDLLSPAGHVNYDMNMLRLLSKEFLVDCFLRESFFSQIPTEFYRNAEACPASIFPDTCSNSVSNRLLFILKWRYNQIRFINSILKRHRQYDYVFFSSIDIFSFSLATRFRRCDWVSFVDHGVYRLMNKGARFFYKHILKKEIQIIALEEYISQYLVDYNIKNKVSVIHHPIPLIEKQHIQVIEDKDFFEIFAPSTSNDERFITQLIQLEAKIPSHTIIHIRSNARKYEGNNLVVYNRRIPAEEYDKLFNEADFILLPYESTYNYRTSAILFESLNKGKRVILLHNNTLSRYFDDINNCICLIENVHDLLYRLTNIRDIILDDSAIERFMEKYSDEYISNQIKMVFT